MTLWWIERERILGGVFFRHAIYLYPFLLIAHVYGKFDSATKLGNKVFGDR